MFNWKISKGKMAAMKAISDFKESFVSEYNRVDSPPEDLDLYGQAMKAEPCMVTWVYGRQQERDEWRNKEFTGPVVQINSMDQLAGVDFDCVKDIILENFGFRQVSTHYMLNMFKRSMCGHRLYHYYKAGNKIMSLNMQTIRVWVSDDNTPDYHFSPGARQDSSQSEFNSLMKHLKVVFLKPGYFQETTQDATAPEETPSMADTTDVRYVEDGQMPCSSRSLGILDLSDPMEDDSQSFMAIDIPEVNEADIQVVDECMSDEDDCENEDDRLILGTGKYNI